MPKAKAYVRTIWKSRPSHFFISLLPINMVTVAVQASTPSASSGGSALLKQRVLAAIRGAFVADAASMGVHWIYDPVLMLKTVDNVAAPEFKTVPTPQFYSSTEFPGHYQKGMLSPFGEQLMFVTEYVANAQDVVGADMSKAMFEWAETFGGRPDHALSEFVANMKKSDGSGAWPNCGADDAQGNVTCKLKVWNTSSPRSLLYPCRSHLYEGYSSDLLVCWQARAS